MNKILTSPSSFGQITDEPFKLLAKNGFEVINNPFGRKLTEDEVIDLAQDCIGIIAGVEPITERVLLALPKLKCISRVGVGMDNVNLEITHKLGIQVINTPDGPTRSVAEHTIAMTLSLLRRIPQADHAMKSRKWEKQIGNLLQNKVVGVIGLGRIGKMVAELFKNFGNPVVGFDLYPNEAWSMNNGIELVNLIELLQQSDIVTLHIPGNKDKTAVIGPEQIQLMKNGSFLVNIARGGIVDEVALYNALIMKKISGAAIDVFSDEPYTGPLCDLDNVILTPHIGSYALEGKLQMEIDAVDNLLGILKK